MKKIPVARFGVIFSPSGRRVAPGSVSNDPWAPNPANKNLKSQRSRIIWFFFYFFFLLGAALFSSGDSGSTALAAYMLSWREKCSPPNSLVPCRGTLPQVAKTLYQHRKNPSVQALLGPMHRKCQACKQGVGKRICHPNLLFVFCKSWIQH